MTPRKTNSHIVIEEDHQQVIANEVNLYNAGDNYPAQSQAIGDKPCDEYEMESEARLNNEIIEPKVLPELRLPSVMPRKRLSMGFDAPDLSSKIAGSTATKEDSTLPPIQLSSDKSEMSPKRQKLLRNLKYFENKENPYLKRL